MSVNTLIEISSGQITTYVNLGLGIIAALVILGFLFGLAKGFWKKTFAVVFFVISFLCLILFIKPLGNSIYNYDITQISNTFNISLPDSVAEAKTIGQLVYDQIEQIIASNNTEITLDAESIKIIDGLALSVIQLAVFIIGVVLIFILGSLFCPLLYHLIFKWIIPKKVRKEHKIRVLGGVMGMIETICILSMLLVPFSALVNTVALGTKDVERNTQSTNSDNEIYNLVTSILEGYNNSLLAKAFFTVTIDGKPIDIKLMDYIMDNKNLEENNIHLLDEIQNLSSVALDGIAKGVISLADGSINYSVLLESEFVKSALYTLSDSSLICTVLPIALTISLNMVNEQTEYDFTSVNFDEVDWSDSIRCVADVFDEIRATGIVTEDSIQDPGIMLERIKLDRSYESQFTSALSRLGDSDFAKVIMPQMVTSYLTSIREEPNSNTSYVNKKMANNNEDENNKEFTDYLKDLPEQAYKVETYQSIDWGKELVDLLEIAYDIADQFNIKNEESVSLKDINSLFTRENIATTFFGIDGERKYLEEKDYQNNIFINGGTIDDENFAGTKAIFGCSTKNGSKGILDLQIVNKLLVNHNALPRVIRSVVKEFEGTIPSEYINDACDRLENEVGNWKLSDWKKEVSNLIDTAVPLVNAASFIVEGDNDRTIDNLCVGEGNFALKYFADSVDNSFILSEVAPLVMEAYCQDEKNDTDLFLNIKLSDLNFTRFDKDTSFGKEFAYIADNVLPKAKTILDITKSEKIDVNTIIDNNEDLASILECAYQSQILNRKLTAEEIKKNQTNNFQSIMIDLLTEPTKEQLDQGFDTSLNIPTITDNLVIVDKKTILNVGKKGNPDWVEEDGNGEIRALIDVICSLRKTKETDTEYLLTYINDKNSVNIEEKIYEMGNEVERVFKEIDDSQLMKDAFPKALNTMIKDAEQFDRGVDFSNVTDWTSEGIEFRQTLDKLNELKKSNTDTDIVTILKDCDKDIKKEFEFEKPENETLRNKYDGKYYKYFENESNAYELMGYIHETESINLPEVIYSAVDEVLSNVDNEHDSLVSKETLERSKDEDFLFEDNSIKYDNEIYVNWNNEKPECEYYRGELYNVARLLSFSDSLSKLNEIENEEEFDEILEVTNNTYVVRSLFGEIMENSFKKLCTDDSSSSDIVKSVFGSEHADYGAFSKLDMNIREDDKIECRVDEITARKTELDVISELNTRENDLNKLNEEGQFDSSIIDLTEGGENSKLTSLLTKLHDSQIFNSVEYVSKNIKPGEVRKYTSFENIINEFFKSDKNGNSMLKELTSDELFALNNREENDKWIKNGEDKGEIVKFNNAINKAIGSQIYTEVVKSDDGKDKLDVIKSLYEPNGKQNHLEEFSTNLSNSYLLELQLPHIYDEYIYKSLKDSAPNGEDPNTLDYKYYLIDNPYEKYHEIDKINWSNEGGTIDSLIVELNTNNLNFENVGDIDSDQIGSLLNSLSESSVLAYDSSKPLSENADERSFYEYIICSIDSNIKAKIYNDNIFEIDDVENQRKWITTKDIKNFKSDGEEETDERDFIIKFMTSYDKLKGEKRYDDSKKPFKFIDGNNFVDISTLDEEKITGLIGILHDLFDSLYQSDTFNFRDLDLEHGDYYIKGSNYLNRTTYEHGIICLSNKIRKAICDNLLLDEKDGYRINTKSSNYLNTNNQFIYEQEKLINVLDYYKMVVEPMKSINNDPVSTINKHRNAISDLFDSISLSIILNDTNDANKDNSIVKLSKGKNPCDSTDENYLSLYDDIVIYVLNETNKTIYNSLKFAPEKNTMNILDMKTKNFMENQEYFNLELSNIIGEGGVAYYANELGLNNGDVTFDINFILETKHETGKRTNKENVMSLLKLLESSHCFNFTKSGEGYAGRQSNSLQDYESKISTFEKIALSIFNQETFKGRIYDESNIPQNDRLETLTGSNDKSIFNDNLVVVSKIMEINNNLNKEKYIEGISFFDEEKENGEIEKLFKLFDSVKYNQSLSFSNLEEGKSILNEIGKIYILHDIEPKQIRELSTSQSIKNDVDGGMNNISEACIVNQPSYYHYENRNTYETFNKCAESYVAETNAIIKLLNDAVNYNVSGNIDSDKFDGKNMNIFENLLVNINESNIFRPISSDIVVKIFSQIQIVTSTITWSCDYFINNLIDSSPKGLEVKTNIVAENFVEFGKEYQEDIYRVEGVAFDKFLDYAIKRIKGKLTSKLDPLPYNEDGSELIGYHMIENFDHSPLSNF